MNLPHDVAVIAVVPKNSNRFRQPKEAETIPYNRFANQTFLCNFASCGIIAF